MNSGDKILCFIHVSTNFKTELAKSVFVSDEFHIWNLCIFYKVDKALGNIREKKSADDNVPSKQEHLSLQLYRDVSGWTLSKTRQQTNTVGYREDKTR